MAQRIVVVEDTSEILMLFDEILTEEGFEVVPLASPLLALEKIISVRPDLVILDYIFDREAYGWQLLQALKLHRETTHIPVIVCTGALRLAQEIDGYLATREVTLLAKPFSIDELLAAVQQALSG